MSEIAVGNKKVVDWYQQRACVKGGDTDSILREGCVEGGDWIVC